MIHTRTRSRTCWPLLISTIAILTLGGIGIVAQEKLVLSDAQVEAISNKIEVSDDVVYYIRLKNGDLLSGLIREISSDTTGEFLRIALPIGKAKVYYTDIAWIDTYERSYRHRHRTYLMPTAEPIRNNHFVGLWELLFLYGGAGIGDIVSITAGRTFIPGIGASNQLSVVNAKFTVMESETGLTSDGKQFYAVGYQGSWLQDLNFTSHIYGIATFTGRRTSVSTMMFAKIGGNDTYTINGGTLFNPIVFPYATGSVGVGLSMDSRFSENHGLDFIAEMWNADVTKPANTILLLGFRLSNTIMSMDFGMTVAPGPTALPCVSFAWTPI